MIYRLTYRNPRVRGKSFIDVKPQGRGGHAGVRVNGFVGRLRTEFLEICTLSVYRYRATCALSHACSLDVTAPLSTALYTVKSRFHFVSTVDVTPGQQHHTTCQVASVISTRAQAKFSAFSASFIISVLIIIVFIIIIVTLDLTPIRVGCVFKSFNYSTLGAII